MKGFIMIGTNIQIDVPYNDDGTGYTVLSRTDPDIIVINNDIDTGSAIDGKIIYVILEYTKTTD